MTHSMAFNAFLVKYLSCTMRSAMPHLLVCFDILVLHTYYYCIFIYKVFYHNPGFYNYPILKNMR